MQSPSVTFWGIFVQPLWMPWSSDSEKQNNKSGGPPIYVVYKKNPYWEELYSIHCSHHTLSHILHFLHLHQGHQSRDLLPCISNILTCWMEGALVGCRYLLCYNHSLCNSKLYHSILQYLHLHNFPQEYHQEFWHILSGYPWHDLPVLKWKHYFNLYLLWHLHNVLEFELCFINFTNKSFITSSISCLLIT